MLKCCLCDETCTRQCDSCKRWFCGQHGNFYGGLCHTCRTKPQEPDSAFAKLLTACRAAYSYVDRTITHQEMLEITVAGEALKVRALLEEAVLASNRYKQEVER